MIVLDYLNGYKGSGKNAWKRGNEWLLGLVEASDANKRTLIALWNGEGQDTDTQLESPITTHMVQLDRDVENIEIRIIDSTLLY